MAEDVLSYLNTENGHTAGQSLARLEEAAWRHEHRLDKLEAVTAEGVRAVSEFTTESRADRADLRFTIESHIANYRHERRNEEES